MASHVALPSLIRHAQDERGPFILETQAQGSSIATLVERGPLPADMLAELARVSFRALAEIHALPNELALGDLAPEDLFVGQRRGAVCFVDFGQSSWRGHPPDAKERGTLPYSPPEVARGEALWTQGSDVYALAAIMLFAALGREPCRCDGPARLTEIGQHGIDGEWVDKSELPERIKKGLTAALTFEPAARVSTASRLLTVLDD